MSHEPLTDDAIRELGWEPTPAGWCPIPSGTATDRVAAVLARIESREDGRPSDTGANTPPPKDHERPQGPDHAPGTNHHPGAVPDAVPDLEVPQGKLKAAGTGHGEAGSRGQVRQHDSASTRPLSVPPVCPTNATGDSRRLPAAQTIPTCENTPPIRPGTAPVIASPVAVAP